jgi:hypothetical protein
LSQELVERGPIPVESDIDLRELGVFYRGGNNRPPTVAAEYRPRRIDPYNRVAG